ncbi:hydrolase [Pseudomonas aeruginosa]|nr:hydrolase [Pseudomonas aeruginosa]
MSEFHHKLVQRKVRFDFSDTPLHWVPGEAEASQVMNVLHMLLPSGELWFCRLYNKALPLVSDARLRDDVQGFIRQEAMHSRAHDGAIQRYLSRFDIDSKPFTDKMDFLFERLLCDYPLGQNSLTRALDGWWLRQRCAIIAAVEHFTCVLGKWVLEARELDRRGSDPVMLDLLRWHGAEEVEHRSVAHDLHVHLGGSFVTRQLTMLLVIAILVYLLADGTRTLLDQDPSLRGASARDSYEPGGGSASRACCRTSRAPSATSPVTSIPGTTPSTRRIPRKPWNTWPTRRRPGARRTPENNSLEIPASAAEAGTFPALVHCYVRSSQTRPADGR